MLILPNDSRKLNRQNPEIINQINHSIMMSSLHRNDQLELIQVHDWDLIIIGGGITGAGILLDAASRGLRALLLEKHDFAWGTSSRSTKLIHGGLRYLKQMEIGLVREVGQERAIVFKNARHIVRPEKMLLPIIENGSLGKTTSSIGLWVYDWLADVDKDERRKMLTKEETLEIEGKLNQDILLGGGLYYEYRTDDARLTIEILKKAVEMGASALNYAEVTGFNYENKRMKSLIFNDAIRNRSFQASSKCIINATGPWVDIVRKLDEPKLDGKKLRLTKGVHLVIDKKKLNLAHSVYFDVPHDQRMIFCIPRRKVVYMGTTDTDFQAKIDHPNTSAADAAYILQAVNHMFPEAQIKESDVISSWAGLRPLIHEEGKAPSELSRKDEIFISDSGLISIAGGKLTGYRKMAERIIKEVKKRIDLYGITEPIKECKTKNLRVSGNDFHSEESMAKFQDNLITELPEHASIIRNLFSKYGSNTKGILQDATIKQLKDHLPFEHAIKYAEIQYAIKYEMVHSLADFCIRRTGMLYFDPIYLMENLEIFAEHMQNILQWSDQKMEEEIYLVKLAYQTALDFND